MNTDEKIAVGVALVVVGAIFMSFLPALWSEADQEMSPHERRQEISTLNLLP